MSGLNQTCTNPAGDTISGIQDGATLTVTNFGSIGGGVIAISAVIANVTNSGTISGSSFSIFGSVANVVNTGFILGGDGFAASHVNLINSGIISSTNFGVLANSIADVTNSGVISGGNVGIFSQHVATITNSGIISGGNFGIASGNTGTTVINSGIITGATGLRALGPAILTNSGAIIGTGGTAVDFSHFNGNTLSFLPGSQIEGAILLGSGDSVSVVTGPGLSTFTTVTPSGPFTLTAGGNVPFVVSGNQVASLDPTPFALADKVLMDFTRSVSAVLEAAGSGGGSNGPISTAFAPNYSIAVLADDAFGGIPAVAYAPDATVFKNPTFVASDGRAVWARGFGGERFQDADGVLLGSRTTYLGGAVGFDMVARSDLRLGLFAGGGESRLTLAGNAGSTSTDTTFGGLYGRWGFVSFGHASSLDVALHGGGSTNATSRTVLNNLAPGGIEIATASYNSSYVSPELKYGIDLPLWSQYTLTPSLRVRYVAGFFGGYTEAGTAAPLTVAGRTINDFEERGELQLSHTTLVGPDLLLTSVHLGAIGLERAGDTTVDTVLLGANLPFVTPGRNDVAGVVGGGGFEWHTRQGVSFFGAAEGIGFSDQSAVWSARGGVRMAF